MFLSCCSPISRRANSVLPAVSPRTRAENDNAARLSQAFEPGCDVDAIAKDVAILDDDVAHVDADTQIDALVRWQRGIAFGHCSLDLGRTAQGVDDAGELD